MRATASCGAPIAALFTSDLEIDGNFKFFQYYSRLVRLYFVTRLQGHSPKGPIVTKLGLVDFKLLSAGARVQQCVELALLYINLIMARWTAGSLTEKDQNQATCGIEAQISRDLIVSHRNHIFGFPSHYFSRSFEPLQTLMTFTESNGFLHCILKRIVSGIS